MVAALLQCLSCHSIAGALKGGAERGCREKRLSVVQLAQQSGPGVVLLGCGTWENSMVTVTAADAGLLAKASTHGRIRQEKQTETKRLDLVQSFLWSWSWS